MADAAQLALSWWYVKRVTSAGVSRVHYPEFKHDAWFCVLADSFVAQAPQPHTNRVGVIFKDAD